MCAARPGSTANALLCIPPNVEPPEAVRAALEHARTMVAADREELSKALEQPLAAVRARYGLQQQRRWTSASTL